MSGLKAIARVTLSEQVAMQIAEMIAEKRWSSGQKLPAESELCAALNVGRSTLREALKSLAFAGLVRMRAGDGTYVAEPSQGLLDRILAKGLLKTEKDLADVCETRLILESEVAALAAERATDEDIAMLDDVISRGTETLRGDQAEYSEVDMDFHLTVARCSKNMLLPRLLTDFRGLLVEWIAKSQELPGVRENAHEQHKRILKSIAEHNPEAARREMKAHLDTFQRAYKLLGKLSHQSVPDGSSATLAAAENVRSAETSSAGAEGR
jgi:GntR family transcriptional repressor for pyruvate dehydrogenase complex